MFDYRHMEQKGNSSKYAASHSQGLSRTDSMPFRKTLFFLLLFFTIAAIPLFIHAQWITGVMVNAILIFCCLRVGFRPALFLAFIPSLAALSTGLLPLAMSPIIPFIVSANIMLLTIFHLLARANFFLALTIAAFLKFQLLYWSTHFLVQYFLPEMFIPSVLLMMGWHQFATALVGGMVAFFVLKGVSGNEKKQSG